MRDNLTKMSEAEARDLAEQILSGLDLADWTSLVPEVQSMLLSTSEDGVRAGFGQIGYIPSREITDLVNDRALEWAKSRSAELVGMQYNDAGDLVENPNAEWTITDSTREMLRGDVTQAIEDGTSTDDLADQLEASYAFSADRSETIARTELARADVEGNMIAYRDSGAVSGKEWILGSEHDDDDECDEAAAMGVVELDDDFGGIGDPPAHPNCECDVLPVLADDA